MVDKNMEVFPENPEQEDELVESVQIEVDSGQASQRIDQFLANRLAKVSRSKIQAAIEAGMVKINGKIIRSSFKISGGDIIEMQVPVQPDQTEVIPEPIPLNIIYEDEHVMVINKPPGMVVHPAAGVYSGTLVNGLAHYFKSSGLETQASKVRYGLVHRIDKETSGLLVVAKNDFAHAFLAKQFFQHTVDREYLALVWGEPDPSHGMVEAHIGRDPKNRQRQFVFKDGLQGKAAITHYELVESYYYTSLLKCVLETGRTHQIRVHMKFIGHPLFNDERYGGDKILKGTVFNKYKQFVENCYEIMPRFGLHAKSLGFEHPHTHKRLYFEVDMPEDFKMLISKWKAYTEHRKEAIEEEQ